MTGRQGRLSIRAANPPMSLAGLLASRPIHYFFFFAPAIKTNSLDQTERAVSFMETGMLTLPSFGVVISSEEGIKLIEWALLQQTVHLPPSGKIISILSYVQKYKVKYFIETGTYLGDTVDVVAKYGQQFGLTAYTIELSQLLYENALNRFSQQKNVYCLNGDSKDLLPNIIEKIDGPAIFWLDGHYSGGVTACGEKTTPILEELNAIFASGRKDHVILIDDIRLFGTEEGYPDISEITGMIASNMPESKISILNDILRVTP